MIDCPFPKFIRIKEACNIVCVCQSSNGFYGKASDVMSQFQNYLKIGSIDKDG
jgi:hypothetical protein